MKKIVVVVGPTASGKTNLALRLAKNFNGEIVNADSRQLYREMSVGTAKPEGEWKKVRGRDIYMVKGVPHHLIDAIEPGRDFSLAEYKKMATEAIEDVIARGKLPVIVGGTGLYVSAIVDNLDIPKVPPSSALRAEFGKKSPEELVEQLKKFDPEAAATIDLKNPRRVIRALEVAIITGKSFIAQRTKSVPVYDSLEIGIEIGREELNRRISERVDEQMKRGLVAEVSKLMKKYGEGYWILPSFSSIGYREAGDFLRGRISEEEAVSLIKKNTRQYAKRQMTWFGRDKRINWIKSDEEAEQLIGKFLNK